MILGIFPDASNAEILLNNLSEADFNLADVSLVMRDQKLRSRIAKDAGPLKGVHHDRIYAYLVQAGLSEPQARAYQEAVEQGKVLAAMETTPDAIAAAKEMFADQSGELILEIKR